MKIELEPEIKNELIRYLYSQKIFGYRYCKPIKLDTAKEDVLLPFDYDLLEEHIEHCHLCNLSKYKQDNINIGNPKSNIVFISTNTDFGNEMLFVLFKKMLNNVLKLQINDICILNIIKCHTNIKVTDEYINRCLPYIKQQIDIIKPKLIVSLGNSYKYLLDDINKSEQIATGEKLSYNGIDFVVLYDLEFIYKNPSNKKRVFEDLQKIKQILEHK
jgi:DNA polymerase